MPSVQTLLVASALLVLLAAPQQSNALSNSGPIEHQAHRRHAANVVPKKRMIKKRQLPTNLGGQQKDTTTSTPVAQTTATTPAAQQTTPAVTTTSVAAQTTAVSPHQDFFYQSQTLTFPPSRTRKLLPRPMVVVYWATSSAVARQLPQPPLVSHPLSARAQSQVSPVLPPPPHLLLQPLLPRPLRIQIRTQL